MKRAFSVLLIALFITIALAGCNPNQKEIQNNFFEILEKPASEENIDEALEYLNQYLSKMDEEDVTYMVHEMEHYILNSDKDGIDYNEWKTRYEGYIDPALTGLYQIMAEEQESPLVEDTILLKGWAELAKRTHDIELYIKENRDLDLIKEDFKWIYGYYLNAMIMGTNATPIFDYKTSVFSEDAKLAYETFITQYPDSTTAWALKEYFSYLNSIQFKMDYNDKIESKQFFDTCTWLVLESRKRVTQ